MKLVTTCVAMVAATPMVVAEPVGLEVGGYAGRTSSNVMTKHSGGSIVSSSPHEGAEGFSFAAFIRYPVLRPLSLEANVTYAQKGYDVSPQVHVHYLELPVLARLDLFPADAGATGFLYAGLAPSVRVACTDSGMAFDNEIHEAFSYSGPCEDAPLSHTPNRFDLGGVLGGGVGWRFGFGLLELQAREVRGLVDVGGRHGDKTVNHATYFLLGFSTTLR